MLPFVLSTLVDNDKRDKVDILYQEHYASMMFAAISFAKCEADAEDIVHDAFIKIIRFIDKIDTSDNIKTRSLCIVITKHVAIDRYRKNSSHIDVEFTDGFFEQNDEPIPLDFVLRKDGYKRLVEIIKDLKEPYKEVCILKFVNELTDYEISQLLDMKLRTVNTRIYRGRKLLIKKLRKEGYYA